METPCFAGRSSFGALGRAIACIAVAGEEQAGVGDARQVRQGSTDASAAKSKNSSTSVRLASVSFSPKAISSRV